jgi:hypothetical protein
VMLNSLLECRLHGAVTCHLSLVTCQRTFSLTSDQ